MDHAHDSSDLSTLKRRRSPSSDEQSHAPPPAKIQRTTQTPNHLQINYLARQNPQDLPLITPDGSLNSILSVINDYHAVLERHESLACNLGARPLGPILIRRFERLFDGPPKVLKAHTAKDGTPVNVTWLDVVEFARNKPEQFTLGQVSEGARVCQFYTKQCRVQISEEDFLLIDSGLPQKLIPPQPIAEDEEKELGTLEIIERNVQQISHLADQVAARARQFNHKLRGRKQAIIERRASEPAISGAVALRASSPSNVALMNGVVSGTAAPHSPSGFVAVNSRHAADSVNEPTQNNANAPDHSTVSQTTRDELLKTFFTISEHRQNGMANFANTSFGPPAVPSPGRTSQISNRSARPSSVSRPPINYEDQHLAASLLSYNTEPNYASSLHASSTPVAAVQRQSHTRPSPADRDDGGPFRAIMVGRLENLAKGDRIVPPCDRCRRLHMDCLKNLTACMGCTKKHAKCSWRDVLEEELNDTADMHGDSTDFAADGDVSMLDRESTMIHDHLQQYAPLGTDGEQQHHHHAQQQQQPSHGEQDYSHTKQYRTHDEEMQAARSLAMAAASATQAQMLMQRDPSVSAQEMTNGTGDAVAGSPAVGIANMGSYVAAQPSLDIKASGSARPSVDPGLSATEGNSTAREGVTGRMSI